jgi:Xaa-Pro aminopeptidase
MITTSEYAARRARVLESLDGAAGIVFAGEGSPPLLGRWSANSHFRYLTGLTAEPGAAVLFDPSADDPARRIVLFLASRDPEREHWDGAREPLSAALRERTGFGHIARAGGIAAALTAAAKRTKRLACLHPFSVYPSPVSPDLAAFRQILERVPGVAIEDLTALLPSLRAVKSPAERALMERAAQATGEGYAAALRTIGPGVDERTVAEVLEVAYRKHGGEHAYNPIVGGGINATVLHYMENGAPLAEGALVLIDSGAAIAGYAADVTRTFPVSGCFSDDQRALYELVLAAEEAAISVVRAGVRWFDVDRAARAVFEAAGYPDAYTYMVGHPLGLDVHEAAPDTVLRAGMVITIEPGIYLPDKALGIRIEDDLFVTESGSENLTAAIPKTVAQIETAMARRGG